MEQSYLLLVGTGIKIWVNAGLAVIGSLWGVVTVKSFGDMGIMTVLILAILDILEFRQWLQSDGSFILEYLSVKNSNGHSNLVGKIGLSTEPTTPRSHLL